MTGSLRRIAVIARREVASSFAGPTAWIVLAISGAVACAAFFAGVFEDARPATLRSALLAAGWALLATAPAISMRAFSEEFRLKTWETLFASPLTPIEMVLGKAIGCAVLVLASLVPLAVLVVPLEVYAAPDLGEAACGLLGLFLAGLAASSIGIAVSAATASQTVAFLGAFFLWFALVVGSRLAVGAVPLEWAPTVAACDPLRRLEGFALGLFDTGAVAYFLALAAAGLVTAVVLLERLRIRSARSRIARALGALEGPVFVVSAWTALAAAGVLFAQPALRTELDATKTRAYSLAPSTEELLAGLEGPWKVLLFVDAAKSDPAVLRQVDEVLERFQDANPAIDARRIDPTDPASSGVFEAELAGIVAMRAGDLARSEEAIRRGLEVFDAFRAESATQPAGLRAAAGQLPAESPARRTLEQLAGMFAQVAEDGGQFRSRVSELAKTSATRPLPDIEGARSALAQGFRLWSDQLSSAASIFAGWRTQTSLPAAVRGVAQARVAPFEEMAMKMLAARQELEALPALEFDLLGRELTEGEAAVVVGAGRMATVPAWRIFPRSGALEGDAGRYSFSFRGEEVLSGAIRSIASGSMPEVVFLHGERDSLLRRKQDFSDLTAVADALRSAGFGVTEWTPGRGARPAKREGRPQVFVVLPALRRAQLELSREERLLATMAAELVAEGAPVLVTAGRSMLAVLGQPDPWDTLLEPFGLSPDAGKVVLELVARDDGTPQSQSWQLLRRVPDSPIAPRLAGRPILLNQPLPIEFSPEVPAGVSRTVVAEIEPDPARWISDDWRGDGDGVREVPASKRLTKAIPVAVTAERSIPGGMQRVAIVGSGGWLLTSLADLSDDLGGGRTALGNAGNRELLLALTAWLAGRGDLLDAGLSGREVPRIEGLGDGARRAWLIAGVLFLVGGPIALGAIHVGRRRRRA
ncbi:MAG: ABC transporter permease [Planctomycetaceae bacterium]|nr:ABC transporter permease [Planctomycetaceae bacterium]